MITSVKKGNVMRKEQCRTIVVLLVAMFLGSILTGRAAWADLVIDEDDSVIITVDDDEDGTGALQVIDSNAGSPVTVINADAATTTVGSAATQISGTLTVVGPTTTNGTQRQRYDDRAI